MKDGFITALGTPLEDDGSLVRESFSRHIDDQITNEASALLVMGTMGNEAYIRDRTYADVASCAVEAASGRVPVLVGVMDCSISRVIDRIRALEGLRIDGVVATAPYYLTANQGELETFFSAIGEASSYPVYLYDLPPVTQTAIAPSTVLKLMKHTNIKGIKSGVLPTCRILQFAPERRDDFLVMYSGLDTFDVAWSYGICKNLDGMFACTPSLSRTMFGALGSGDIMTGRRTLDAIVALRNALLEIGVFTGFTAAMNLLGYRGSFSPDYVAPPTDKDTAFIRDKMKLLGAL